MRVETADGRGGCCCCCGLSHAFLSLLASLDMHQRRPDKSLLIPSASDCVAKWSLSTMPSLYDEMETEVCCATGERVLKRAHNSFKKINHLEKKYSLTFPPSLCYDDMICYVLLVHLCLAQLSSTANKQKKGGWVFLCLKNLQ